MKIFGFICACALLSGCIDDECYRSACRKLGYTGEVHGLHDNSIIKHCLDENGRGYPVFINQCQ